MAARWIIIPHLMYVIMQVTVTTSYADGDMVEDDWTGTGTGYSTESTGRYRYLRCEVDDVPCPCYLTSTTSIGQLLPPLRSY